MTRRARSVALMLLACVGTLACDGGRRVTAPDFRPEQPPMRIVAGSIFATEVLLEIAPRERIAGVHTLAQDPAFSLVVTEVADLPKVGAEPERLLAVRPDLVIIDAFTRPETQVLLESAGVPVVRTLTPRSFDDIEANIRTVGRACHCDAAAEALVARMRTQLQQVRDRGAELGAWHVCNLDGGLHTHGRGSLFDAMMEAVGARNLAAERGAGPFRRLSLEAVLAWRPDALIVDGEAADQSRQPEWFAQSRGLQLLPCTQRNHVLFVPGRLLGTTSHRLVDTAALVQAKLRTWGHP
ncbi:MAG: ABC transporter substrate-binding protein [Planctomycetota bacterium]|nr:ABC transporter substrate-binding protein [Planctomycetota bacterium]